MDISLVLKQKTKIIVDSNDIIDKCRVATRALCFSLLSTYLYLFYYIFKKTSGIIDYFIQNL
jgi:hypothetical protein